MKMFALSPHVFVFVGLAEMAAAQAVATTPAPNKILGWGGFILALLAAFFAFRRDQRDRILERRRLEDQRREDERERTELALRQGKQHADNQLAALQTNLLLGDLQKSVALLLQSEEKNRAARHGRRNDVQHFVMRFAHNEHWMTRAAECTELPLPPFDALPPIPHRRHDDTPDHADG
jgi:hypothetical protein